MERVFVLVRSGFTFTAQSETVHAASGEFTTEEAEIRELRAVAVHGGVPQGEGQGDCRVGDTVSDTVSDTV